MKNNNSYINRFKIGLLKGIKTPTLPKHILDFNQKPLIRLFRVIGGVSTILIVTNNLKILGNGVLYLIGFSFCFLFSWMLIIYLIYLTFHRIKHIYKLFKNK